MRRPLVLFASSLALTAVLAGCGDDDDSTSTDPLSGPSTDTGDAMTDHGGAGDGAHGESSPVAEGARRVEVTGDSLSFDPTEIRVAAGEDIAIALTSGDMLHDFTVEELDAHVSAEADDTAEGGFHAGQPGRYTFYCSVDGHRDGGMEGTLIVE